MTSAVSLVGCLANTCLIITGVKNVRVDRLGLWFVDDNVKDRSNRIRVVGPNQTVPLGIRD